MNELHIGSTTEFIQIEVPISFSNEGWAQANVEVAVRCFRGRIAAYFEASDFERFFTQLQALYARLDGEAELAPLERQFVLMLRGNGRGQILVEGEAWSQATHEKQAHVHVRA